MLHVKWKQLNKRTQPAWSLWRQKPIKILTRKSCCYFCRHLESASKNIPKQYLFIFLPFHFLPQDPLLTRLLNVYYSLASLRRVVGERKLCSFEQSLQENCSQANLQRGEADSVRLGGAGTQKDAQGHCTLIQPVSSAAQMQLSRVSSPIGQREEDGRFLLEDGKEDAAFAFF